MKRTVVIEADTSEQINALLKFLKEVGIKVSVLYDRTDDLALSVVSEPSLNEAWDSKEDERWDELYGDQK